MTEHEADESALQNTDCRDALSYFSSLVFDTKPREIPPSIVDYPETERLTQAMLEIRNALLLVKKGDFSYCITCKGFLAGALKALQSNLNHVAWLTRRVADGDLEQRMDFMGEFSTAFNSMTEQLSAVMDELKKQREYYSHRALHDPLTGLNNRAYFDDEFKKQVATAKRCKTMLALAVMDLDNFKQVNDSMGHQVGDALIVEVAKRLLKSTRESDTVTRFGGDEYVIMFPISSRNGLENMLQRILLNLSEPLELSGGQYQVSVSIGVSIYPDDTDDPDTLLRLADKAMYKAKMRNKSAFIFANS